MTDGEENTLVATVLFFICKLHNTILVYSQDVFHHDEQNNNLRIIIITQGRIYGRGERDRIPAEGRKILTQFINLLTFRLFCYFFYDER